LPQALACYRQKPAAGNSSPQAEKTRRRRFPEGPLEGPRRERIRFF